jgi:hypothetical protein
MKITVLGIDLAKNVFQLREVDDQGTVVLHKKHLPQALALCGTAGALSHGYGSLPGRPSRGPRDAEARA